MHTCAPTPREELEDDRDPVRSRLPCPQLTFPGFRVNLTLASLSQKHVSDIYHLVLPIFELYIISLVYKLL